MRCCVGRENNQWVDGIRPKLTASTVTRVPMIEVDISNYSTVSAITVARRAFLLFTGAQRPVAGRQSQRPEPFWSCSFPRVQGQRHTATVESTQRPMDEPDEGGYHSKSAEPVGRLGRLYIYVAPRH
jgi:hypothetical protein